MNTLVLTKTAYAKLVQRQTKADTAIARLEKAVQMLSQDEVSATFARSLERESRLLDQGKGKRFQSVKAFRSYVRAL